MTPTGFSAGENSAIQPFNRADSGNMFLNGQCRRPTVFALAALGAICLPGCSKAKPAVPSARLEGAVLYRGQPVERGGVSFGPQQPGSGGSIWAPLVGGRYIAPAVPRGKVLVQINAVLEEGQTVSQFGKAEPNLVNIVPPQYRAGVIIDVEGDKLDLDFDLSQ
jgi:hypothetical protein